MANRRKSAFRAGVKLFGALVVFLAYGAAAFAQNATLAGKVTDSEDGSPIEFATVRIVGTYSGAVTDSEGNFEIKDVKPGDYSVRFSFSSYTDRLVNGVTFKAGETVTLNVSLSNLTTEEITVVGEKNLVDLESGKSEIVLDSETLENLSVNDVQSIAATQVGVSESPDGLQVRGGRVYETQYYVDGVSAQSRLAGTGFGVDVSSNAIDQLEIITGGASPEYGGATAGLVLTKIKEGDDKFRLSGSYRRDNFGFEPNSGMSWNTDEASFSMGGPLLPRFRSKADTLTAPKPHKLFFFASGNVMMTDEYFNITADQLQSSIMENDEFWAPRQDNRWSGTFKLTFRPSAKLKVNLSTQSSVKINQNANTLRIIGNDDIMRPGLQYPFSLDMDNAQTYTHRSNLSILKVRTTLGDRWVFTGTLARLFSNVRADANGRPFRDAELSDIYDARSIITSSPDNPLNVVYNLEDYPDSSVVQPLPTDGLINNGGRASLWHDHYEQEYTAKFNFAYAPANKIHYFNFGWEHREQEYQWVDVTRPWVGAPIRVNDTLTISSNRIGIENDIWKVNPAEGGLYFSDKITYKGIIANLGVRFNYWAAGKFADDAIENENNALPAGMRDEYRQQTVKLVGRRWRARILPNINVSFPVTANNVLYFNYNHAMRTQHPRFLYAGLNPEYLNTSLLAELGNPNLQPETTVAYEAGLKSQLTKNWALTVAAFYRNQFDFVVSQRVEVFNPITGRDEVRNFRINQDYARVRGVEVGLTRRIGKWFWGQVSGSYQSARGKSNSALESELRIRQDNPDEVFREQYLLWDRPLSLKGIFIFNTGEEAKLGFIPMNNITVTLYSTWQSGLRYTRQIVTDTTVYGRLLYETDPEAERNAQVGESWFWTDLRVKRRFDISPKTNLELFVEFKNLFNTLNDQIINPITGEAWNAGDAVTASLQDPRYRHPENTGLVPSNPARFRAPRQFMIGANFNFN